MIALEAVSYSEGFSKAWANVATFIPKLIACIVILVVGYFIAKAIATLLTKVLQRVGFDDLVERGGVKKALEKSKYDAASILAKIVLYAIMLFVLSTAFGIFGTNPVSTYLKAVIAYLPLVFVAIIIVVIASAIAAGAKGLIVGALGSLSYGKALANTAAIAIMAFGVVAALDQLHIAASVVNAVLYTGLVALAGTVIVAVGGGGIKTMSERWEAVAAKYDEEKPKIQEQVRSAPGIAAQASAAKEAATTSLSSSPSRRPEGPGASSLKN